MFEIFKTFSSSEINFFENYLKTKFFNGSDILLKLFNHLLLFADFNEKNFIQYVFKNEKVLGRKYPEQEIINYCYKLVNKAKEFLSFSKYLSDEFIYTKLILEQLDERDLDKNFLKLLREMLKKVQEEKDSSQKFFKLYYLFEKKFNFTEKNNHIQRNVQAEGRLDLIKLCSQYKLVYLFLEQVSLYVTYKVNQYSYGNTSNESNTIDEELIEKLHSGIKLKEISPLVKLYFKLFLLYKDFTHEMLYYDYKDFFLKMDTQIHADEIKFHYNSLVNYCLIKKLISDNKFYQEELSELYKLYLSNKLFIYESEKYIRTRTILNIIKLFKLTDNIDWIKDYLNRNEEILNPKDKKNIKRFLKIYFNYSKNDFKSAINEINKINNDHFTYKYEIQTLKIRLLYDMGEDKLELALDNIISYRSALKCDDLLLMETKEKTLNFLKYTEVLIKKFGNKKELNLHYDNLKTEKHINFKKWLLKSFENQLTVK